MREEASEEVSEAICLPGASGKPMEEEEGRRRRRVSAESIPPLREGNKENV